MGIRTSVLMVYEQTVTVIQTKELLSVSDLRRKNKLLNLWSMSHSCSFGLRPLESRRLVFELAAQIIIIIIILVG
jgi:hypothetical protein